MRAGRGQPGLRRHLLLGAAGARPGPVRVRLARPGPGPAARRRHPRRPGHRHRQPAAVAGPRAPGDAAASTADGTIALARRPAGLLPQLAGLPRALTRPGRGGRRPLRRPPGRGDVARLQRAGLPQRALLLRRQRRGVPGLAARALRRPRPAQRRLGHRLLEPALRRLGRDQPAARRARPSPTPPSSSTSCASPPTSCAPSCAPSARCCKRLVPAAGHHQLHDRHGHQAHGLPLVGGRRGPRLQRPLPDRRRPAAPTSGWRSPPTSPAASPAATRGCSWSTPPARSTGSRATSPSCPASCAATASPHVARGADGVLVLPVARLPGRRREVPLRAGPARRRRTPRCSARSAELGADLKALAEVRGSRVDADGGHPVRLGGVVGASSWTRTPASTSPTPTGCGRSTARCGGPGSPPTSCTRRPTSSGYRLVLVPTLYLVTRRRRRGATPLRRRGRARSLVTYFSGIVDEHDHIRLGGYPGAFRELLGVRAEEFFPLLAGEQVTLDDGSTADVWTEWLHPAGAEVVASYQRRAAARACPR